MRNNVFAAITGGIGSGKSEVLSHIGQLGYKIINLDEVYADLLQNTEFLNEVCAITGTMPKEETDGRMTLNRKEVSEKVFSDPDLLKRLNEYTHPIIMREAKKTAEKCGGVVFCEVPLLYESGLENLFDYVLVITREKKERVRSVSSRSGLTEEEVEKRIKNQFDYANLVVDEHTIVIENNGNLNDLYGKVELAIKKIIG